MVNFFLLCKNVLIATLGGLRVQYPLSENEHAAMSRYLSGVRKQLQDVCDLFTTRYGKNSPIAEISVKTLVSATLLEHELMLLEGERESISESEPDPEGLPSLTMPSRG